LDLTGVQQDILNTMLGLLGTVGGNFHQLTSFGTRARGCRNCVEV
jgi:hypothetical protein